MKLFAAFFRLIRWPNLVFIIITQLLFYYCIYVPMPAQHPGQNDFMLFCLLILASVLIAAAGYIINDYFDMQIDAINKPGKVIIDKYIKRRWAILMHWAFSSIGLLLSIFISYKTGVWLIAIFNFLSVNLLWFYSTTLKKKLLWGNISVSVLTAWVILIVYFFVGANFLNKWETVSAFNERRLFKFTVLYAGFAFIMTLIREVIKDTEDMEGDRKYNCNTMPIAWGVPATKVFAAVWLIVGIASLAAIGLYAWQSGWWLATLYILLLVIAPMIFIVRKLYAANVPADYYYLSTLVKMVMLAGILSMLLLKFIA